MNQKLGNIEILTPSCNMSTVQDGRGGIFTWVNEQPILEFNMLYFHPSKVRGNHYHPHFTEYFLVVDGTVLLVTRDPDTGADLNLHAGRGTCFRVPAGTPHAIHAITEAVCISLLTKPWDESDPPIVHENLIPFDKDYLTFVEERKSAGRQAGES